MKIELRMEFLIPPYCFDSKSSGSDTSKGHSPELTDIEAGARAWQVVSLMDGLTVEKGHEILKALEPNIQGKVGRPIGWIADAIDYGLAEIVN